MENGISIYFPNNVITVNNDAIFFDSISVDLIADDLPESLQGETITNIRQLPSLNRIEFICNDGGAETYDITEENYNKWIKPYYEIWRAEKDRIEQEEAEKEADYNKFENKKARALTQLNADFETAKQRAHIMSRLGFEVDANQTANENVNGLLVTIGDSTVQFCDYYNQFHELNKTDLQTLQNEIIQNAQSLYTQKWSYRNQIEQCENSNDLEQVVSNIHFMYRLFTAVNETETGEQA